MFEGARVGVLIGVMAGLVPLGIGYLRREKRKALAAFVGCIVAGAIGGLSASIAVMALGTAQVFRSDAYPVLRKSPWSRLITTTDKFWYLVMTVCLFVGMFGTMFVSAAFLTPLVLGVPNYAPRNSTMKVIEFIMLFGGLGFGTLLGFIGMSFISRRFISSATHSVWAQAFDAQTANFPALLKKVLNYGRQFMLPRTS